jgi:hypothetical protein
MRKYLFLSLVLSVAIFGCSNNPINSSKEQSVQPVAAVASGCTQSAAMKVWEALTQTVRDDKIINLGNSEIGGTNSGQCKGWVTHIVKVASNQAIDIPSTCPDQRYWYTNPCMPVYGRSTMIENVGRADILQMYYNVRHADGTFSVGPHTAIVLSKNSTEMVWIDCNFVGPGANRVGTHAVTYADFKLFTTPTTVNPNLGWSVYHIQ